MNAFTRFITVFFNSLNSWFNTIEKLGSAAENLATVADESSGQYKDEARIRRRLNAQKSLKELGIDLNSEEAKAILNPAT